MRQMHILLRSEGSNTSLLTLISSEMKLQTVKILSARKAISDSEGYHYPHRDEDL